MAEKRPSLRWALDSNFVLDLAAGKELALVVFEIARDREIRLCITPIVVTELQLLSRSGQRIGGLAAKALARLRTEWRIEPLGLDKLDRDIAKEFASDLIAKELIPLTELNDAIVLGEAAVAGIPFVISSDQHLVAIEPSDLAAIHVSKRLPLVYVMHPAQARRSLERFG